MAKGYKFEKEYTHIVRDSKSGLVTGHVVYPAGHEGLIKDEHVEGANAAKAGKVVSEPQQVAENANAFKSGSDNANV